MRGLRRPKGQAPAYLVYYMCPTTGTMHPYETLFMVSLQVPFWLFLFLMVPHYRYHAYLW